MSTVRTKLKHNFIVVQMLRGRIVQINDKGMKIATQGNFGINLAAILDLKLFTNVINKGLDYQYCI